MILTPRQRLVFRMHRKDGVPQKEIAAKLRITPESVCRLLSRAEQRLRTFVTDCPRGAGCSLIEAAEAVLN